MSMLKSVITVNLGLTSNLFTCLETRKLHNCAVYDNKLYSINSYTSIGHIIIGQLHYLWGKKMKQSIIVLGILTLTIPLNPSIIYGSFLNFQSFKI